MHLRHASRCKLISCPTNYCLKMKSVLQHIHTCHTVNCTFNHCQSSKALLSHMTACKKKGEVMKCAVCAPVMRHMASQDKHDASMQQRAAHQQQLQYQQQAQPTYQAQQAQHSQYANGGIPNNPTQHAIDVMTQKYEDSKNKYIAEQKAALSQRMAQAFQSVEYQERQLTDSNVELMQLNSTLTTKSSKSHRDRIKTLEELLVTLNASITNEKDAHKQRVNKWNRDVKVQVDNLMRKRDEQIKSMRTDQVRETV